MEVPKLLAKQSRRDALERCDQIGQSHLGRIVDQQMHMVVFAIELHQLRIKILAHAGEYQMHGIKMLLFEHVATIFCYEYQVDMKGENAMSSVT